MMLMEYPSTRGKDFLDYDNKAAFNLLHAYIDSYNQRLVYEYPGNWLQVITIFQSQC